MMMKKITSINLAGRAFHVEEDGYAALRVWLDEAGQRLAADPDRAEILRDFEAAIASHASGLVGEHKDVVTDEEMADILQRMGAVEPADGDDDAERGDTTPIPAQPQHATGRRLYRIREAQAIGGVCTGMAAYFGVEVALVRLAWVLAALISGGVIVVAYIVMIAVVPEARTPDELAAAHGTGSLSAQDVVERVRAGAPVIDRVGTAVLDVLRVLAKVIGVVVLLAALGVAIVGAVAVWQAVIDGSISGARFDGSAPAWHLPVFVGCLMFVLIVPLLAIALAMRRAASTRPATGPARSGWVGPLVACIAWAFALAGVIVIAWSSSASLRHVARTGHGKVTFGEHAVCVGTAFGTPDALGDCGPRDASGGTEPLKPGPTEQPPPPDR